VNLQLEGEGFALRRATAADVGFLASLAGHEDVEPYMAAVSVREEGELHEEVRRGADEPQHYGRFVIEVDGERAGSMAFEVKNRRSRIANLRSVMLHPDFRGRGLAEAAARRLVRHLFDDLDYHRIELEVYGFNERALRHAERIYVREGVKRKAYWRHGRWVDGVLFGLIREDLDSSTVDAPAPDAPG
jgi:RimJ/RimL family protein N-acetyltransferase